MLILSEKKTASYPPFASQYFILPFYYQIKCAKVNSRQRAHLLKKKKKRKKNFFLSNGKSSSSFIKIFFFFHFNRIQIIALLPKLRRIDKTLVEKNEKRKAKRLAKKMSNFEDEESESNDEDDDDEVEEEDN